MSNCELTASTLTYNFWNTAATYIKYGYINNNIWHLHSLSINESQSNVYEIRVSLRYTL